MLYVKFDNNCCNDFREKVVLSCLKMLFLDKMEQNNASKQKVVHCKKNYDTIFCSFLQSENLYFIDIPCQNSAKNIQ